MLSSFFLSFFLYLLNYTHRYVAVIYALAVLNMYSVVCQVGAEFSLTDLPAFGLNAHSTPK